MNQHIEQETMKPAPDAANIETGGWIILYDGDTTYTVSAVFFNAVRCQIEEVIPALERGKAYRTEDLCGDAFWKILNDGERRMAGRCVAHMVARGMLPLSFVKTKHEYPKRYKLI